MKSVKASQWTREESKERFPYPMTPLGWSIMQDALKINLQSISKELGIPLMRPDQVTRLWNGYVYSRKPFFGSIFSMWPRLLPALILALQATAALLIALVGMLSGLGFKRAFLAAFTRFALVPRAQRAIDTWQTQGLPALDEMKKSNAEIAGRKIELGEYFELKDRLNARGNRFLESDFLVHFTKSSLFRYLAYELHQIGFIAPEDLTVGLKDNVTMRMYRQLKRTGRLDEAFAHLTDNWDIAAPTLGEKKEELARLLSGFEKKDLDSFESESKARRIQVRAMIQRLYEENGAPAGHVVYVLSLIELFERLVSIDEEQRFYSSIQYPAAKNLFYWMGAHFHQSGQLKHPAEVYFLELSEIDQMARGKIAGPDLQHLIVARKVELDRGLKLNPPMVLDHRMQEVPSSARAPGKIARGTPAYPGRVQGRARTVRSLDDLFELKEGEIAVLLTPNPVYGPFLDKAAAIVCETGGVLSHGAIVARELSIPAIMGAEGILDSGLADGDLIKVDAVEGVVTWN